MADEIQSTLASRGARYGDFTGHAKIAQDLQEVMRTFRARPAHPKGRDIQNEEPAWNNLSPVQRQALTVIADKIARILNGDPNYDDNWRDIAGYATLALDRCAPTQRAEEAP